MTEHSTRPVLWIDPERNHDSCGFAFLVRSKTGRMTMRILEFNRETRSFSVTGDRSRINAVGKIDLVKSFSGTPMMMVVKPKSLEMSMKETLTPEEKAGLIAATITRS